MPHPVDIYVGSKLRYFRTLNGLTQGALANKLNLTFQQIQKYEKGTNRISASRLYDIAKIFKVPIQQFFEGYQNKGSAVGESVEDTNYELMSDTSGSVRMLVHFRSIKDAPTKKALVDLLKALSE